MQVGVLHMRKAGGTSVVENVRRACEKIHVQEWGMFHIHSDKYNILTLRNPVRRAVSSYLFEGGAPQCWEKRIHRPEQLVACLQRYNALLPFHLYRTISMRLWKQRGSTLTFQSEYNGARVGVEGKIGRPYIPNYFMHKLTGDGNFTRALARVDAVDMIVIPGRVPIRWSSRPVPPCLESVSWNVSWSAEGYVHERTAVDDVLQRAKRRAFESMDLTRYTSLLEEENSADVALFTYVLQKTNRGGNAADPCVTPFYDSVCP